MTAKLSADDKITTYAVTLHTEYILVKVISFPKFSFVTVPIVIEYNFSAIFYRSHKGNFDLRAWSYSYFLDFGLSHIHIT